MKFVGCCVERKRMGLGGGASKIRNRVMENKKCQSANEISAKVNADGLSAAL